MKVTITIEDETPCEFHSVQEMEQWLQRERDRLQSRQFQEHLNDAAAEVAKWPQWKQDILGRALIPTRSPNEPN